MENIREGYRFERDKVQARMDGIISIEEEVVGLEQALYDFKLLKHERDIELGRESQEPSKPTSLRNFGNEAAVRGKKQYEDLIPELLTFGEEGSVSRREEDSDDGIGFESNATFSYEYHEGLLCISSIDNYRQFGWSGDRTTVIRKDMIVAVDAAFPLVSHDARPSSLAHFDKGHWMSAVESVEKLIKALRWRQCIQTAHELLEQYGYIHVLEKEGAGRNKDVKVVKTETDSEVWSLQQGDTFQSYNETERCGHAPLYVSYKNKVVDQEFRISLEEDNIRPYVWRDKGFDRSLLYKNHLDYIENVLENIVQGKK